MSFRCRLDKTDLIKFRLFNRDEKVFERVDITCGLAFSVLGWSWQALRLHHGLSDQLESMLHPLEEKGVVPVWQKEIVVKRTIFYVEPRSCYIIYGVMLKVELVYQEILLSRLDVPVAPKSLDFILGTFLERVEWFRIEAIGPLSRGNS